MHDAGRHVPAIDNRPSLTGYTWLWEAFSALTTCRSIGMSYGPIPWTAVQHYTEAQQMNVDETYLTHHVIRHMDNVYLKYQESQRQKMAKANKPPTKRSFGGRGRR